MSKINYNIGLCGEYRLTVLNKETVAVDTGWCKNTILSGGLEYLATESILNSLKFIDFGTSTLYSGEYSLPGVVSPSLNTELINVSSNNIQYYPLDKTTQVYYATFSTDAASYSRETLNEFCIKTLNKTGFSRTVFPVPVEINIGQNINFEYRVSVNYANDHQTNAEFVTYDGSSFYIPVTSKVYNLPNFDADVNKVGKLVDRYPLYLLQNNDELPEFGTSYPTERIYGVNNSLRDSVFYPSVVYSALDNTTKRYSVVTEYDNLSAPLNTGIFNNINSALLVYNDIGFNVTRFAFPITLYNTTLYVNNTSINSSNLVALYYGYTWGETLTSTFTTPVTFSLSAPQLIPCNINLNVDLYPRNCINLFSNNFTTTTSNGNTTRIRVNLLGTTLFEAIDFKYYTPQIDNNIFQFGPSPYRMVVYDSTNNILKDTGYVFPNINKQWNYNNTAAASLAYYNTQLRSLVNETITGSTSGNTTIYNLPVYSGSDYIDVVVNSPFIGTSWELEICALEAPTPCDEIEVSGGPGITEKYLVLSPRGGIIIIDFEAYGIPDKLELIHNNTKVATTGMTVPNSGPFDNVYGSSYIPSGADVLLVDQFIGTYKESTIPTRDNEFAFETSITDVTRTGQQLIWWQYGPDDYAASNKLTIRVTGPDGEEGGYQYQPPGGGTAWTYKRRCTNQTPTPGPLSIVTFGPNYNNQNSSVVSNGTFRDTIILPNSYLLNNIDISDGTVISPSLLIPDSYSSNNISIEDGELTSITLILPIFIGVNSILIGSGSLITQTLAPNIHINNNIDLQPGTFTSTG